MMEDDWEVIGAGEAVAKRKKRTIAYKHGLDTGMDQSTMAESTDTNASVMMPNQHGHKPYNANLTSNPAGNASALVMAMKTVEEYKMKLGSVNAALELRREEVAHKNELINQTIECNRRLRADKGYLIAAALLPVQAHLDELGRATRVATTTDERLLNLRALILPVGRHVHKIAAESQMPKALLEQIWEYIVLAWGIKGIDQREITGKDLALLHQQAAGSAGNR